MRTPKSGDIVGSLLPGGHTSMSRTRRLFALAVVPAAASLVAGSALAYVCHPSSVGTRMLTLKGSVLSVQARGGRFDLLVKTHGSCSQIVWNTALGTSHSLAATCATRSAS